MGKYVCWFDELTKDAVAVAGGKGANLGELVHADLPVPQGFVVTASAYRAFVEQAGLRDELSRHIDTLNVDDHQALEATAKRLQSDIRSASMPLAVREELTTAYRELSRREGITAALVAVRSSATMEDTKQASFAGMNQSFLNVRGEDDLARMVREVWASLYSPRVIFYRKRLQLPGEPEIAVVVQTMVNAEKSGVAFSIDPATGNEQTIIIEAAYGLGEVVVGGQVEPDHYAVSKTDLCLQTARVGNKPFMLTRDADGRTVRRDLSPEQATARVLTDEEVRAVAELVRRDEAHYGSPQDVEWAIEGGNVYLVQSRPVTASGRRESAPKAEARFTLKELVRGLGASPGRATGHVKVARSPAEAADVQAGDILVAPMTSPDWVPFMRRAAAIVTDSGGMTSHAAIVSRELGVPSIVGARQATAALQNGMLVTVDATRGVVIEGVPEAPAGEGHPVAPPVSAGLGGRFAAPITATKLMVNLGEPERASEIAARPVDGVGLLRAEFMIMSALQGVHPRRMIAEGKGEAFVDRMVEHLRVFGQAFFPRPVIYRSTDFRTNEFRGLTGGEEYEPHEENPMIGVRGAYRYVRDPELFRHELQALKRTRQEFPNLHLMIPFVRTGREFRLCKQLIDESGLTQERDFQLWVMAEVPSIVYWLDEYARLGITGVSIGSNDLTQLVLGVDRDNELLGPLFDERDRAVMETIRAIISGCRRLGLRSSLCGQAPSVYPDYAETLVRYGIDSISVNPDVIDQTRYEIAAAEQRILLKAYRAGDGAR